MSQPIVFQRLDALDTVVTPAVSNGQLGTASTQPAGVDLNNLTAPGKYYFSSTNLPLNKPSAIVSAGMLVSVDAGSGWYRQTAVALVRTSIIVYVRQYSASTWSSWFKTDTTDLTSNVNGLTSDVALLMDDVARLQTAIDNIDSGGVNIPIGSQTVTGILRLAQDSEVTAEQNGLAATASQVSGAKTAAAIANAGVATANTNITTLDTRVTALEGSSGGGSVTVSPTGGLEDTGTGLAIKLRASELGVFHFTGLHRDANGLIAALGSDTTRGSVYTVPETVFASGTAQTSASKVPQASAHLALYNRVTAVEDSLGDISTALAAFLRI